MDLIDGSGLWVTGDDTGVVAPTAQKRLVTIDEITTVDVVLGREMERDYGAAQL